MTDYRLPKYLEAEYERALKKVAREAARLVGSIHGQDFRPDIAAKTALNYADLVTPWAGAMVREMAWKIRKSSKRTWDAEARRMGAAQRGVVEGRQVGDVLRMWMDDQVALIRSIPIEAAERVHREAVKGLYTGERAGALEEALRTQEGVSISKAKLIARTETGRAQSTLVMVQAEQYGSEGYLWRTARDGDVRPSHKAMEGRFVRWDQPPTLDKMRGHAGAIAPNCRCYPDPVMPWESHPRPGAYPQPRPAAGRAA